MFVKLDAHTQIIDDFPSVEEEGPISAPDSELIPENDHSIALFRSNTVYPGFHTVSTVAYMVFCTTIVVTFFDVVRQLRNNYKLKKSAYSAVPTEGH